MNIDVITSGIDVPHDIHVIIEIPCGSSPVKYEMQKESGVLYVDRLLQTAMYYPAHYGFIPHTLSHDGDPIDVLVYSNFPLISGCVMRARPIAVLEMEDEKGQDEKIIAVPHKKICPQFESIQNINDIHHLKEQIMHFFEHYKDLEPKKWVKCIGWGDVKQAKKFIQDAINRAKKS